MSADPIQQLSAMLAASLESFGRAADIETAARSPRDEHNGQTHLVAIVAHELRSPLVPIRNVAALLRRGALDATAQRQAGELIDRQVAGMIRLIGDLVDVSQVRSGNLELMTMPVTLADLVDRSVELIGSYVSARGHKLNTEVAPETVYLVADSMRICQALQNLVANAAKYTDKGGEIRIRAYREGSQAVIVVSDNGIGLAADQVKVIFDMFAQDAQAGSRRSEGGLGIGLFLTRNLVEAHGGSVTASSAGIGLGSEFTVRLPCEASIARLTNLRPDDAERPIDRSPS
jgi:signal transduction histidine kinase